MDDFVISNLNESRNEWCSRLVSIFTPLVADGVRSIFDEAKIELKRTLKNKETADFLKSLGHQIVEFANNINTDSEDSHSEDIGSSEEPVEHDSSQEEDSPEPPPAPSKEPSPQTTSNDDSDEIPPSPLPDDNE